MQFVAVVIDNVAWWREKLGKNYSKGCCGDSWDMNHLVLLHRCEMQGLLRKVVMYVLSEGLDRKKACYLLVVEEDVKKMTSDRMER